MKLFIFGPPGAGKGTYSSRIASKLNIVKISTGDMFREEITRKTAIGRTIERYVTTGSLVPDDIVVAVLKKKIDGIVGQGFILDGFPRTLSQAQALDAVTQIDAIVNLLAPTGLLVEKISSRRICRNCGEIYNIADINTTINNVTYLLPPLAPKHEGVCDKCGGELYQRADDRPDVVLDRLDVYKRQTQPVLDYYRGRVPFIDIEASKAAAVMADEITRRLEMLLVDGKQMDDSTSHDGTGRTLVLIKPDGVQRRLIGEIIGRFEKARLRVTALRLLRADAAVIAQHYPDSMAEGLGLKAVRAGLPIDDPAQHGRKVLGWLRAYLASGSLVAILLKGDDAVARARAITGYTDPAEAENGTIRGDLGEDSILKSTREHRPLMNLVHSSGNVLEADREIDLWFPHERVP